MCRSNKFPGDADPTVPGTTTDKHAHRYVCSGNSCVGWSPFVARILLGPCTYIQNILLRNLRWEFKDNLDFYLSGGPCSGHTVSPHTSFCTWQHKEWPRCALSYLAFLKIYAMSFFITSWDLIEISNSNWRLSGPGDGREHGPWWELAGNYLRQSRGHLFPSKLATIVPAGKPSYLIPSNWLPLEFLHCWEITKTQSLAFQYCEISWDRRIERSQYV